MKVKLFAEVYMEIECDYTPERPPIPCQNHDSPHFSDPGDDESCEITDAKFVISRDHEPLVTVDVPQAMMDYVVNNIYDDVIDKCRQKHEADLDAAYLAMEEARI